MKNNVLIWIHFPIHVWSISVWVKSGTGVEKQEEKEINRTDGNDVQSKDEINTTAGECMERQTAAASAV